MWVCPSRASGLVVPTISIKSESFSRNLTHTKSFGVSPSPSTLSWSPIGILSFGHHTTGCFPLSTSPLSFSLRNCHLMNLSYLGLRSVVMKLLLQSTLAPSFPRSSFAAGTKISIQCLTSENFFISSFLNPRDSRIAICFGSFSFTLCAAAHTGVPVQCQACGNNTLYPCILLYLANTS